MRARFVSRGQWQGKDVYCYDDLDTGEIVYLEGGRHGREVRRYKPYDYPDPKYRLIDVLPKHDLLKKKDTPKPKPFEKALPHIHWAWKQ